MNDQRSMNESTRPGSVVVVSAVDSNGKLPDRCFAKPRTYAQILEALISEGSNLSPDLCSINEPGFGVIHKSQRSEQVGPYPMLK